MRNGGCGEHRRIGACSCGGQKRWCRGCLCSSPKKWGLERLIPACQLVSCCILLPEGCGVCPSAEPRSGAPAAPRAQRAAPISGGVSSQIKPNRKPPSLGLFEGLAGLCVGQHLGERDLGAGQGRGVPPSPPGERPRATSPRTGGGLLLSGLSRQRGGAQQGPALSGSWLLSLLAGFFCPGAALCHFSAP